MDVDLFLQRLRELPIEDGRAYIQEHIAELSDHKAIGELLADEALRVLYAPFLSLKIAELLIYFGEYVHDTLSHALGLKAKGDVLRYIGHHQAAIECLDTAGEEFLSLGDECNWARSRISWIVACAWLGRIDEALEAATQARGVFLCCDEPYWVCIIDHNTGVIYRQIGRYQDAFKLYEAMLAIYPTIKNQSESVIKRSMAMAQVNQAINLAWLGRFEEAYRLQIEAQSSFTELGETSHMVNSEINLADFDYTQGYYGSALRRYYRALDDMVRNSVDDPMLLEVLKLWMAKCLVKLNRSEEAWRLASEAVEVCRQLGTSLQTSDTLREYGLILVESGRLKEAFSALDEAGELFSRSGFDYQASVTKLQQAELLLKMGSATEAYDQARLVRKYFETQHMVAYAVHASLLMTESLIARIQQLAGIELKQHTTYLTEAQSLGEQTISLAQQYNLQEEVYKSYYLLGKLEALKGNYIQAEGHYRSAIMQIENILDDLVYDLSPSFLHITWMVYEDMIALCLLQSHTHEAFSYLEQARSMALRQYLNESDAFQEKVGEDTGIEVLTLLKSNNAEMLRIQQELKSWQERHRDYSILLADIDTVVSPTIDRGVLLSEMKRCEAKITELFERQYLSQVGVSSKSGKKESVNSDRKRIKVTQVQEHLTADQLLLAYFLYKGKLVIFAMTAERLLTHEIPDGVEQLEYLLPLLHARLMPTGWSSQQEQVIRRLLKKLYDLLVAPVATMLPPSSGYVTIVPYGPLHKLPFHALYDGSRFLIEEFQVNYLPASSIITQLDKSRDEYRVKLQATGVDHKKPLIFGYAGSRQLQRALEEAKSLATILGGQCYLEREATIKRLMEQASGSPIIHLATHGQSRLDAPNFSSVLLADGQLNAIDAFHLDLRSCELVTLSGCETGLALSGGGDEQLGLGRAFLAAGATSLVMSLWPVEDNATNELMQRFYQELLKGESKVQALRTAQRSLLACTSSTYTHPYFWASFRLVGDAGPLTLISRNTC